MAMLVAVSRCRNLIANEKPEHEPSEVATVKLQKLMPNSDSAQAVGHILAKRKSQDQRLVPCPLQDEEAFDAPLCPGNFTP